MQVKYFTTAIYDALGTCGAAESRRGNVSDKYKWLNSKTLPAVVGSLLRTLTLTFEAMNAGCDEKNSEVEKHELAESLHDVVKLFFKIVNVTKKPDSGLITHSVRFISCTIISNVLNDFLIRFYVVCSKRVERS